MTKGMMCAVPLLLALLVPSVAAAVDGTGGADYFCLYTVGGIDKYCLNNNAPVNTDGVAVTFNGLGGNDVIVIVNSACGCDCPGGADAEGVYAPAAGIVATINAGDGADEVAGGDDQDLLYGDGGNDSVAGFADDDIVHGGDNDDILRDKATLAADVHLFGDAGNDCLQPTTGCTSGIGDCDCGAGSDTYTCAYCINCETTAGTCAYSCPAP